MQGSRGLVCHVDPTVAHTYEEKMQLQMYLQIYSLSHLLQLQAKKRILLEHFTVMTVFD